MFIIWRARWCRTPFVASVRAAAKCYVRSGCFVDFMFMIMVMFMCMFVLLFMLMFVCMFVMYCLGLHVQPRRAGGGFVRCLTPTIGI